MYEPTHRALDWDPKEAPKLDFNECYYSVLEVVPSISPELLKKAYYKMVARYHPDKKDTDLEKELCNRQMMVINAAYKVLRDDNQRIAYDIQRSKGIYGAKANVKGSTSATSNTNSNANVNSKTYSTPPPATSASQTSASPKTSSSNYDKNKYTKNENNNDDRIDPDLINKINIKKKEVVNTQTISPTAARFKRLVEQSYAKEWEKSIESDAIKQMKKENANSRRTFLDDSSYTSDKTSNYNDSNDDDEELYNLLYSRGDGSTQTLKKILNQLKQKRQQLLIIIADDSKRDWGEVTDLRLVERRLKNIENNKLINNRIGELERELRLLGENIPETVDFKSDYRDRDDHNNRYNNNNAYNGYDRSKDYELEPQPQRQRQPPNTNKPRIDIWEDYQPKQPKRKQ